MMMNNQANVIRIRSIVWLGALYCALVLTSAESCFAHTNAKTSNQSKQPIRPYNLQMGIPSLKTYTGVACYNWLGQYGTWYGAVGSYTFTILDKQGSSYANGAAKEIFKNISPVGTNVNKSGNSGGDTWPVGATFTDTNGVAVQQPAMGLYVEFDQYFKCIVGSNGIMLNDKFHIKEYYSSIVRTGS